ncbi:MAG: hypothetical protein LBR69_02995 [Endomicrobium sp.]|jgi:hypothetical protein|nr:hypothetical protein [Endomicrobium sp.]
MRLIDVLFPTPVNTWQKELCLQLMAFVKNLLKILNGGLNFKDNFDGSIVEIIIAAAGAEVSIDNIYKSKIPEGYIVIKQNSGGTLYASNTWTETTLFFTATQPGTYKLLIF